MPNVSWTQSGQQAILSGPVHGRIDMTKPHDGLRIERVGDQPVDVDFAVLAFGSPAAPWANGDWCLRGSDLLASFAPTEQWPLMLDLLWRATDAALPPGVLAAVDAIVSVRTELLEERPQMTIGSRVRADAALRSSEPAAARFAAPVAAEFHSQHGASCTLFRPEGRFSYAQMVYPPDVDVDALGVEPPGVWSLTHRLFARSLEKGVVLRGRVRGLLTARADDEQIVAAAYRAFAAEEPFLGT
jgi:hypothetical protein